MKIITSSDDDFLYLKLINLLNQVKLVQSGSAIPATLRRHKAIKDYLISKQKDQLAKIEDKYFEDGNINNLAIEEYHRKRALQVQKFNVQ